MTPKQILDAFSETLMQDERILSPRERELLTSLLQNSRSVCGSNFETQEAVNAAIAQSVGETVAQRAFALLGGSIVEQILGQSGLRSAEESRNGGIRAEAPQPPPPAPQPPGVKRPPIPGKEPQPPSHGPQRPGHEPQPPSRSPQPPGHEPQPPSKGPQSPGRAHGVDPLRQPVLNAESQSAVSVLDASPLIRAESVVLDEFLSPQELDELMTFATEHELEFQSSEVISPSGDPGVIDFSHRRSRVLMDLGRHESVILDRVHAVLPRVLEQLGMEEFSVTEVETQMTASNDGDFFRAHSDDGQERIASRRLTFVYFFHREPRPFEGGELRLHDSRKRGDGGKSAAGTYQSIVPQQNQIVFFPCSVLHEITQVNCPSRAFADSRFTVNGWLHN